MTAASNIKNIRTRSWLQFAASVAIVILTAITGSMVVVRLDLTSDKRFSLSSPTRKILSRLKNDIYIQVYLDGEMPIPFKRLKRSVREMLDEFRIASGRRVDYEFINPSASSDSKQRNVQYQSLLSKGLNPIKIHASDKEGGASQKIIFPGMIVNYNGIEVPVNFLKNNLSVPAEENLLHSEEGLEYDMIQTISTLNSDTIYKVAFLEGQGEIPEAGVADITLNLARFFTVDRGKINGTPGILDKYAAVIVAGPQEPFTEEDKFVLDQYIMNGGKVVWLIDEVSVNTDSLVWGETAALYRPLNIEDQIFRYGARINPVIVQDLDCVTIRLKMMTGGTRQQIVPVPWYYFPKLTPDPRHPITRNLNKVEGQFISSIDTVGLDGKIRKTVLLRTSRNARILNPPFMISLKEVESPPDERLFNQQGLAIAVLLEGTFPSAFRNRFVPRLNGTDHQSVRNESVKTKMIVISDGDIIRNDVQTSGNTQTPSQQLGLDKYTGELYGNRDFIINCLNYLVDDNGIMNLRSRELRLRLLDKARIRNERFKWQLINVAGPLLIALLAGVIYSFFRKRKYARP